LNQPETLVHKLLNGDQASFAELVERYQDMVYNTALSIVQNKNDADDITQEVFMQVYLSISSFKGESKFSTWLYQITISKALDDEKKKNRNKRFGFIKSFFGINETTEDLPVEFNHPGVQLEKKESSNALFKALKKLPDNQRIAFTMHKIEGQTNMEVAAIMNMKVTAVEALMSRAKANLKITLQNYYNEKFKDQ
jgi:RNA polymerase sigma-70 factor (ECF subfamily)